jgi:hypothetical protein
MRWDTTTKDGQTYMAVNGPYATVIVREVIAGALEQQRLEVASGLLGGLPQLTAPLQEKPDAGVAGFVFSRNHIAVIVPEKSEDRADSSSQASPEATHEAGFAVDNDWAPRPWEGEVPADRKFEPLNEAETARVTNAVRLAKQAIVECGYASTGELSGPALDALWAWFIGGDGVDNPGAAIDLVGLAFGQLLVDDFQLFWSLVTDELGSDWAVRGPSELVVYPVNSVAKRYDTRDTDFLTPIYEGVARRMEEFGSR